MKQNISVHIIYFFVLFLKVSSSLNILGVFPYEGKSHFSVFKPYLQELTTRGHNVTVITHFPKENDNYETISLAGTAKPVEGVIPADRSYRTIIDLGSFFINTGIDNCEALLSNAGVQNLWKMKKKFDIAVVELFNTDCGLALAYKLKTPVVNINSAVLMPSHYERFGIPKNPSYVPFHFLSGGSKPSLYQKLETIIFDCYFTFIFKYIIAYNNDKTVAKYLGDMPALFDLSREVKFLLVYHNFVLTGSRLFPSNVIEVGGYHVKQPEPLPEDIQKYIDDSKDGVIYVSFGSMVKASTLNPAKTKAIVNALSALPQNILWKWDSPHLPGNPQNIRIAEWLPQNDILAHPNVKAFISHAGMSSTTEALHHAVPMVAVPFHGDQPANAASVQESGLGIKLELDELNTESLLEALNSVLTPKFKSQVTKLSRMWHDRPLPPMDTAIFWTEFAARHGNATFRARAADVPIYEYMFLDLIAIVIGVIVCLSFILSTCRSLMVKPREYSTNSRSKAKKE